MLLLVVRKQRNIHKVWVDFVKFHCFNLHPAWVNKILKTMALSIMSHKFLRSISLRAWLFGAIILSVFDKFSSAFVISGPLQKLHQKQLSRNPTSPHFGLLSERVSCRNTFLLSTNRAYWVQMTNSDAPKQSCKFTVGDQVRVLVKTITLAKTAVQAGMNPF